MVDTPPISKPHFSAGASPTTNLDVGVNPPLRNPRVATPISERLKHVKLVPLYDLIDV